jgi:hypothetical protein
MIYNRLMYSAFMMTTTTDKYFNKGVKAPYAPHIGHIIRGTPDKIIVFGRGGNERYTIYISISTSWWKCSLLECMAL